VFDISILQLETMVAGFLWPLFRIASFYMAIPLIGTRLVPVRARMGLALLTTIVVYPLLPEMPDFPGLSGQSFMIVGKQILVGSALGFIVHVFLQIFVLGGQIIATQMGLGFASMTDPANGVSVVVLSQFYLQLVSLLFLAMNGHLVMIEVLVESFRLIPVGFEGLSQDAMLNIAKSGGWMFAGALLMALPAVTALLIINFSFGIITKAAPQLNIFAVGFPFTMLMGILITWLSLNGFLGQYQRFSESFLMFARQLLQ